MCAVKYSISKAGKTNAVTKAPYRGLKLKESLMYKLILVATLILGLGLSMAPKTTSEFPSTPSYTCTQCWQHCELVQDSPILWHCPCCNVRYAIQGSNW